MNQNAMAIHIQNQMNQIHTEIDQDAEQEML